MGWPDNGGYRRRINGTIDAVINETSVCNVNVLLSVVNLMCGLRLTVGVLYLQESILAALC